MGWGKVFIEIGKKVGTGIKIATPHIVSAAKVAAPHVKSAIKTTANVSGKTINFVAKHPKTALAGTAVALPAFGYHKGLINFAKDRLSGDEGNKKGLIKTAGDLLLGDEKDANGNERSIGEKAIDTVMGNGSYDTLKNAGGAVVGEVSGIYGGVKNGVNSLTHEVGSLYQGGKDMAGNLFSGNGMVADGNGGYSDPTTQQYPSMAQMTGLQQGNGVMSGLMGGMNNAVNTISGGNVSKMNIASLLLSAYMMFGRFGWLGKAASLMLGGMTLKNINNHQQAAQSQQRTQSAAVAQQPSLQTAELPSTEDDVVVRSRRM